MVKESDFKTCEQSSFCRRHRDYAKRARDNPHHQSSFQLQAIQATGGALTATLVQNASKLQLHVYPLVNGLVRVRVTDPDSLHARFDAAPLVLESTPDTVEAAWKEERGLWTGTWETSSIVIRSEPFKVEVFKDNVCVVQLNQNGWMQYERFHNKEHGEHPIVQELGHEQSKEGLWEESFQGFQDTKPKGPSSIALDVVFPGATHAYGLPEHADSFALKSTLNGQPYRLYNLDVFEYILDSPMALYGSIPLLHAHRPPGLTSSVFWLNAAETWVDIDHKESELHTHWMSESGVLDVFVFPGPSLKETLNDYSQLTGRPMLPPLFSIAYHQCRWNYNDQDDVQQVDANFDKHAIPYDVLWLDIEHTDGKRYMTWDKTRFPTPTDMQDSLAAKGRKMVTIVDPHIKTDLDYPIYSQAKERGLFVLDEHGNEFNGWCWPGNSAYVDWMNPQSGEWFSQQYQLNKYQGSTSNLFIWNDMNEPSVFNGPEITMKKDLQHHGGWEHRDVHNVFGMLFHKASSEGLQMRNNDKPQRPFVLSRAFYAGTQKYGAIWTGDNAATWEHLRASIPMLLSISSAGVPFAGADVGGFFGNPSPELLTRWYQSAALQPFFRAHAHLDTQRREPWLFGEPFTSIIRQAIRTRYTLLPYLYTLFRKANETGVPIMRPMMMEYPHVHAFWSEQVQFMLGESVLVRPVVEEGATTVQVTLPGPFVWYSLVGHKPFAAGTHVIPVGLDTVPAFVRSGTILPLRMRPRRSSAAMQYDPYTLIVALQDGKDASGELYMDDGTTFDYLQGDAIHRVFTYTKGTLSSKRRAPVWTTVIQPVEQAMEHVHIENIVVLGQRPIHVLSADQQEFQTVCFAEGCMVQNVQLSLVRDWSISFVY